jgi:hypothetical protein
MALPLLFIGAAVATGAVGGTKTIKAVSDNSKAGQINQIANQSIENARDELDRQRREVGAALESLGKEKLTILNRNVTDFVTTFEKIKNVDFQSSIGLEELKNLHIDQNTFQELKELGNFALGVAGGAAAGAVGGALTAMGAYSAAMTFASASTGTAISALSGAAATNATLAFFGGGSLASGGLGMAGGMYVLGGLVAGPALMVMGMITEAKSKEKLENALSNKAQADEVVESLNAASVQCSAIRRRTYMFYNLLANLDALFLPQVWKMQDIVENEGTDYRAYTLESKKAIAAAASTACTIKAVLDTPILTAEGAVTDESEAVTAKLVASIDK